MSKKGNFMYEVKMEHGSTWTRHIKTIATNQFEGRELILQLILIKHDIQKMFSLFM